MKYRRWLFNSKLRVIFIVLCSLVVLVIYRHVLHFSYAKIIPLQDIPLSMVPAIKPSSPTDMLSAKASNQNQRPFCNIMPQVVNGSWPVISFNVSDEYLISLAKQTGVKQGGFWKPSTCISQHKVAIVVPYRDRKFQLNLFLAHIHPFLQFQSLEYQIFIIEQTDQRPFNRAKLFNIGFKESEQLSPVPCYIFHDVDLLPLNVLNIYGCTYLPRHLSANIDVFDFKVPYDWIFGGAISILKEQFINANGFSNKFFGWGGEDDDFYNRVTRNGTIICRFESEISKYTMLSHKKETPNEDRYYYLTTGKKRFESDGLNSLMYTVEKIELKPMYTRILVEL